MDKKVSIVIVTFNGLNNNWIQNCLSSLHKYNFLKDAILIDNNSTDGSSDYIRKVFPESFLISLNENLGFGKANNIGIKKAYEEGADYVFLLNQDACIEPNTIELLVEAQQREPDYGIVSPIHLNGKGDHLDYKFSNYIVDSKCHGLISDILLNLLKKEIYQVKFVNAAGWLISRHCLEKVGGFNPSFFHYGEDDNYIHRVHYHGLKVGILSSAFIFHDREERKNNGYFDTILEVYKRAIVLKVSNPFFSDSFNLEYKNLYKNVIKSLLFLNFVNLKKVLNKIIVLNRLNKNLIMKNKIMSKCENSTFLS